MRELLLAAAVVVASPATAAADYTEIAPVRPLTMSDLSGLTMVGLDFQYTTWTELLPDDTEVDLAAITFDLAADIRIAPHWVLIGRLPVSHLSIDGDPDAEGCCDLALGNFTAGARGLWSALRSDNTRSVAGFEISASLPTASDDGDGGASAAGAAFARLPEDPGRYAPDTTVLRFVGLAQFYGRRFMAQAELGAHLYLLDEDVYGDSSDLALHLALGAGIRATYTTSILLELNSLFFDSDEFAGNDSVSSLAFGVRYASDKLVLGGRLYYPIDEGLRDLDMIGVGFDVGARF